MGANHDNELELLTRRKSEFKLLFKQYYPGLVRFAQSFLLDQQTAEDVVQNIFIHLWENAKGIKFDESSQAYLFKAVKNRCLNKLRNKNIRDRHNLLYLEGLIERLSSQEILDFPTQKELKKALNSLPPQVKVIIEEKYIYNKKLKEIAADLGVSTNTVKTQLQRGKHKLKHALGVKSPKIILLLLSLLET